MQKKAAQGGPTIKQVLISLRDPNGIAVRPSGFDCVRPCHSERSVAKSNCEATPSKAKVESRADSAQDDTQGATPSEKITKGVWTVSLLSLTENWQAQNFGRELVFSADLCYNQISKKAFLREEGGTRQGFPEANEKSFGGSLRSVTEGACVTLYLC